MLWWWFEMGYEIMAGKTAPNIVSATAVTSIRYALTWSMVTIFSGEKGVKCAPSKWHGWTLGMRKLLKV